MRHANRLGWASRRPFSLALVVAGAAAPRPEEAGQDHPGAALQVEGGALREGQGPHREKKYEAGRKYLTFVFETYPNEPLGPRGSAAGRRLLLQAGGHDRVHRGALPVSRLPEPLPRSPAPGLRALSVRALLRQGKRAPGPGPDLDAGGDRAVPRAHPGVPGLRLRRGREGAGPPALGPAGRARVQRRLLLHAEGRRRGGARPVHRPRAEVSGVRRPRTSSSTTRPRPGPAGPPGRSRRYYGRVIKEFPESEYARKARSRRARKPRKSPRQRLRRLTANPKASNF